MHYKGAGDSSNPDSYRGVALETTALKALAKLLVWRIGPTLKVQLPDEQLGFRKDRSRIMAAEGLIKLYKMRPKKSMGSYMWYL